jgi:hypothetical protein
MTGASSPYIRELRPHFIGPITDDDLSFFISIEKLNGVWLTPPAPMNEGRTKSIPVDSLNDNVPCEKVVACASLRTAVL